MIPHAHGIRRTYQTGCRCGLCRAVNTAYMARYRAAIRAGRPPLGAHVAATEAARVLATLLAEDFTKAEIATWLGHRWPVLQWWPDRWPGAGVTVRTVLRLRAIERRVCT